MTEAVRRTDVVAAARRVAAALVGQAERLTELDQAVGDGDLGITATKMAESVEAFVADSAEQDLGKLIAQCGMAVNRAASSTMGTLVATALMRAGKEAQGKAELRPIDLAAMLSAAEKGVRERGKAQLGDKTAVDALNPAAEAFASTIAGAGTLGQAANSMVAAAREGRDRVTPLQNKIGRAGWLGERSKGHVDPGCALAVRILEALAGLP